MTIDTFWDLIRKSRRGHAADCDQIADNLTSRLEKLDPPEIISFDHHLWDMVNQAFSWDLWAVAYIINGGCSDDGFTDFRGWLVAQGREYFEKVMADPQAAARRVRDEEVECEAILYAATYAYENKTGQELPKDEPPPPSHEPGTTFKDRPEGEPWNEEDLERLYPRLCKRFF